MAIDDFVLRHHRGRRVVVQRREPTPMGMAASPGLRDLGKCAYPICLWAESAWPRLSGAADRSIFPSLCWNPGSHGGGISAMEETGRSNVAVRARHHGYTLPCKDVLDGHRIGRPNRD